MDMSVTFGEDMAFHIAQVEPLGLVSAKEPQFSHFSDPRTPKAQESPIIKLGVADTPHLRHHPQQADGCEARVGIPAAHV